MTSRQTILETALSLGSHSGWEALRLHDIAQHLQIPLADVHQHFPQKDDIVDAWLDHADHTMLSQFPENLSSTATNSASTTNAQRLIKAMTTWLGALAPYHKLTGEMLLYKLEPGHIHLQAAGILRISRTVQWFREAADLKASHLQRIGQEVALSSLFIGIFVYWLNDKSPQQQRSKAHLKKLIHQGQTIGLWR